MKKILLIASMLLLAVAFASAQSGNMTDSTSSTAASGTTVQGCLGGSDGNYTLTDSSGKTWQLQGDSDKLKAHVGHTVAVTGTPASNTTTTSSGGSTVADAASDSSASSNAFQVSSLKHIAPTCSKP